MTPQLRRTRQRGRLPTRCCPTLMYPPTEVCLEQVSAASSAQAFLDSGPAVRVILPTLTRLDNVAVMRTELPV